MSIYNSDKWIINNLNEKEHVERMKRLTFLNPGEFYECPPVAFNIDTNILYVNQGITFIFDKNDRKNDVYTVTSLIKEKYGISSDKLLQEYVLNYEEFKNTLATFNN